MIYRKSIETSQDMGIWYDQKYKSMNGCWQTPEEELDKHLNDFGLHRNGGETVLDIGCGDGSLVRRIISRGHMAIGIELSQEAIDRCVVPGRTMIRDICSGPMPAKYSRIVSLGSLEHVIDIDKALQNIAASLTPGGRWYFYIPNELWVHEDQPNERTATDQEWRAVFERNGLKVESAKRWNDSTAFQGRRADKEQKVTNVCMLATGRYRLTKQTLESLYANTPEKSFNLTVVNDEESDFRVRNLLRSYMSRRNFSLLEVGNSGHVLSQLKNLAVGWSSQRFGRGDFLYISDGDVCFCEGWLDKLTTLAVNTEPLGFRLWGGQIHPFHQPIQETDTMTEHSILDGPSWLMRWKTWNEVGPFNKRNAPGPCQSEEFPFCERICKGGRIGVIHPHVVYHTGLTQTDGKDAPGRKEREALIPQGVLAE